MQSPVRQGSGKGVRALTARLAIYAAIAAFGYFAFDGFEEALSGLLAAVSGEAGHLSMVALFKSPHSRVLPTGRLDPHELAKVSSPEYLRKGGAGAERKLWLARAGSVAAGSLAALVLGLAFLLAPDISPFPPRFSPPYLGTVLFTAAICCFGFAGGLWPSQHKEQVKELTGEEPGQESVG